MSEQLREKVRKLSENEICEIRSNLAAKITAVEQKIDKFSVQKRPVNELRSEQDKYATAYNIAFRLLRKETDSQIRKKEGLSGDGLLRYYQIILEMNY